MLIKTMRLHLDDLHLCWILVGILVVIQGITAGVMTILRPDTIVSIAAPILLFGAALLTLLCMISHTTITFEHGVRMGLTRRQSLGLSLGVAGGEGAAFFAAAALLSLADRAMAGAWVAAVPGLRLEIDALDIFPWWSFPLALAGTVVASFVVGALLQRFGGKAGWMLWGLWMGWFVLFQYLPWRTMEVTNWLIPAAAGLVVILAVWSVWSMLHAVIKR